MFRNPTTDLIVILVIVLLILGPKRLPGLGRSLGQGMREFKDSIGGDSDDDDEETPALTQSSARPEPVRAEESGSAVTPGAGPGESGSERRS
jgi:sec-independent protein translocase protein TatA